MRIESRVEWVPVESATARDALLFLIKSAGGKTPGRDALDRLISELRARARHAGHRIVVYVRIAPYGNGYALDIGDGRMLVVDGDGWRIVPAESIAFVRGDGYGLLPEPKWAGMTREALDRLRGWLATLGVERAAQNIVIAALANALRTGVTYPLVELVGSGGTGKSSAAWALGTLIDPSASGELPDGEIEAEALAALAQTRHVLFIDNVSAVTRDQSDLLCKIATGTEIAKRKLFTDADSVRLPLHRPVMITAVSAVLGRGDAIDRTVRVQFQPRAEFKTQAEFRAEFHAQHAELLGALVTLLSAGLARLAEVRQQRRWHSRMVDVIQIGEAILQAAGLPAGHFVDEWDAARNATAQSVASGDRFVIALRNALATYARRAVAADDLPSVRAILRDGVAAIRRSDGVTQIACKASALLVQLRPTDAFLDRNDWLPRTDRALADALARVQPLLRDIGVKVERRGAAQKKTFWTFTFGPDSGDDDA